MLCIFCKSGNFVVFNEKEFQEWKELSSQVTGKEEINTVSEKEWAVLAEEKCWQAAAKKEDTNLQLVTSQDFE